MQDPSLEKRKEKTTPIGVNLMSSQVFYQAAQDPSLYMASMIVAHQDNAFAVSRSVMECSHQA